MQLFKNWRWSSLLLVIVLAFGVGIGCEDLLNPPDDEEPPPEANIPSSFQGEWDFRGDIVDGIFDFENYMEGTLDVSSDGEWEFRDDTGALFQSGTAVWDGGSTSGTLTIEVTSGEDVGSEMEFEVAIDGVKASMTQYVSGRPQVTLLTRPTSSTRSAIAGVAYNNVQEPLSGVTVSTSGGSETSNEYGLFYIDQLTAGEYTVTGSATGYQDYTASVTTTAGNVEFIYAGMYEGDGGEPGTGGEEDLYGRWRFVVFIGEGYLDFPEGFEALQVNDDHTFEHFMDDSVDTGTWEFIEGPEGLPDSLIVTDPEGEMRFEVIVGLNVMKFKGYVDDGEETMEPTLAVIYLARPTPGESGVMGVVHSNRQPLGGINIAIVESGQTIASDNNGFFFIGDVPVGSFTAEFVIPGTTEPFVMTGETEFSRNTFLNANISGGGGGAIDQRLVGEWIMAQIYNHQYNNVFAPRWEERMRLEIWEDGSLNMQEGDRWAGDGWVEFDGTTITLHVVNAPDPEMTGADISFAVDYIEGSVMRMSGEDPGGQDGQITIHWCRRPDGNPDIAVTVARFVTGSDAEPVAGVSVRATHEFGEQFETYTGEYGFAHIANVPEGNYEVTAFVDGEEYGQNIWVGLNWIGFAPILIGGSGGSDPIPWEIQGYWRLAVSLNESMGDIWIPAENTFFDIANGYWSWNVGDYMICSGIISWSDLEQALYLTIQNWPDLPDMVGQTFSYANAWWDDSQQLLYLVAGGYSLSRKAQEEGLTEVYVRANASDGANLACVVGHYDESAGAVWPVSDADVSWYNQNTGSYEGAMYADYGLYYLPNVEPSNYELTVNWGSESYSEGLWVDWGWHDLRTVIFGGGTTAGIPPEYAHQWISTAYSVEKYDLTTWEFLGRYAAQYYMAEDLTINEDGSVFLVWSDGATQQGTAYFNYGMLRIELDDGTVWEGNVWLDYGNRVMYMQFYRELADLNEARDSYFVYVNRDRNYASACGLNYSGYGAGGGEPIEAELYASWENDGYYGWSNWFGFWFLDHCGPSDDVLFTIYPYDSQWGTMYVNAGTSFDDVTFVPVDFTAPVTTTAITASPLIEKMRGDRHKPPKKLERPTHR